MERCRRNNRSPEQLGHLIGRSRGPMTDLGDLVETAKRMNLQRFKYPVEYRFEEERHNDTAGYERIIIEEEKRIEF